MSQRQRGPKTHYRVKRPMSHALDESPPANGGEKQFSFQGNRYSISFQILCRLQTANSCSSDAWNLEESDDLTSFSPRAFALLSIRAFHRRLDKSSGWNESLAPIRDLGTAVEIKPALTTSSFAAMSTDINTTACWQASCSQQGLPATKNQRFISSSSNALVTERFHVCSSRTTQTPSSMTIPHQSTALVLVSLIHFKTNKSVNFHVYKQNLHWIITNPNKQ